MHKLRLTARDIYNIVTYLLLLRTKSLLLKVISFSVESFFFDINNLLNNLNGPDHVSFE